MIDVKINDYELSDDMTIESVSVAPPAVKSKYIDVPYSNGRLDLTESAGTIPYSQREIRIVAKKKVVKNADWYELRSTILNEINGKSVKIEIDSEGYYYEGRITSISESKDGKIRGLTIIVSANPYKIENVETTVSKDISGSLSFTLYNLKKTVQPSVTASAAMTVSISGKSVSVTPDVSDYSDIILSEGANAVTVTGSGTITFTYRQGGF